MVTLEENAEYHAAKDQQGYIEGRVLEINDIIARTNVIDVSKLIIQEKLFLVRQSL